jgi:hypothetical protein
LERALGYLPSQKKSLGGQIPTTEESFFKAVSAGPGLS